MISFIVVLPETNQIIRSGLCPNEEIAMAQAEDPYKVIIVNDMSIHPNTHYYINNTVQPIPPSPDDSYIFDYLQGAWIDNRSDEELRKIQWELIKAQRDIGEMAPFNYNDHVLDGDLNAQRRLMVLISISKSAIAAGQPFNNDFTLADNTVVNFTAQDFVAIEMAKANAVDAVFTKARLLREQIDQASGKAEITAINW